MAFKDATLYQDAIHLNIHGYMELFKLINFCLRPLNPSTSCPLTTQSETRNPVFNEDLGIGEAEFLGSGWEESSSPSPSPPLLPSPPPSIHVLPRPPTLLTPRPTSAYTWAVSSSFLLKD